MRKEQREVKYWFILDNYVHLSVKKDAAMFYNPLSGQILEYGGNPGLIRFIKRLKSRQNLLVLGLTEEEYAEPGIADFIAEIRFHYMGDILDAVHGTAKPFQMMPVLKVHKDAEVLKKKPDGSVGDSMMRNLVELSLYINNCCRQRCPECSTAFKQFLCCTSTQNGNRSMELGRLEDLVEQVRGGSLTQVNIMGGNIFLYPELEKLINLLDSRLTPVKKVAVTHYLNLLECKDRLSLFRKTCSFSIPVTFPVKMDRWETLLTVLNTSKIKAHFVFIVDSDAAVEAADKLAPSGSSFSYSFQPFYNGKNMEFFRENVFLGREDFREDRPQNSDIYARQMVNPYNFGKLTVLSNGCIYANVNAPMLGNLKNATIYDAVFKEMYNGKSWRRIRKRINPCKSCYFNALCPPLSNYEYALGQNNLCHIF